jgi:simple sugar transport system permease protein
MKFSLRDRYAKHSGGYTLSGIMILVFILMWILSPDRFLRPGNLQSMAFQLPELGLLSLAMMVIMINGGINLSIVSTANLAGITAALILTKQLPPDAAGAAALPVVALAIAAALAMALVVGFGNGLLVAYLDMSPILSTLGTMTLLNGISILMTKGYVISGFPDVYTYLGNGLLLGIPFPILLFALTALGLALVMGRTAFGFDLYMIGTNAKASLFSGVNNRLILMKSYVLSGLLSGFAGIIMSSRFNSAKSDYGASYLLVTVLAAVLGGTSSTGGFGKVGGLVLALVILQFVSSGLNLLQANAFLTRALWGVILIVVMMAGHYSKKSSGRTEA